MASPEIARDFTDNETQASGDDLTTLVEWAAATRGSSALDVATGRGQMALELARHGAYVTMLDSRLDTLDAACGHMAAHGCVAEAVEGDACDLPFEDDAFELVTCRRSAHHFPHASDFFAEAFRVLRPGGRLLFADKVLPPSAAAGLFVDAFERLRDPRHVRSASAARWLNIASDAGFEVFRHATVDQRHDFVDWCEKRGCDEDEVQALTELMRRLPNPAVEWLAPEWRGGDDDDVAVSEQPLRLVGFRNRYLLMAARKPA